MYANWCTTIAMDFNKLKISSDIETISISLHIVTACFTSACICAFEEIAFSSLNIQKMLDRS